MEYAETMRFYAMAVPSLKPADAAFLACNDRYFLMTALLNRHDALHPWLYDRFREVEARPDGYLDLWSRGHYKSSCITFAGIIQELLIDPEITVGIFSNTKDISRVFLSQIKEELELNEKLIAYFPDVLYQNPRKEAKSWSVDGGIVVKRKSNPKEATVEAHGLIDAMPTGRHFKLLVYDDVITEKNVTNPDQIKKTTERIELSDNLGSGDGTRKQFTGTRYHFADTYGVLIEQGSVIPRIYPATEDGTLNGKPVFLSQEAWDKKKRDQRTQIAAQMLQNPLAGKENTFLAAWLRPFWVRPNIMNVYIMADPSLGRHKTSDRTAMAVVGIDQNGNKYLLDGYCHRMSLSEKWKNLCNLYKKWKNMPGVQMISVGYERYGAQADQQYFEEQMRLEGPRFEILELNWTNNAGGESKAHRVGRLEPDFRLSNFYVPAKVWHPAKGDCVWSFCEDTDDLIYDPVKGMQKVERAVQMRGQHWRLIEPIQRVDEDRNIYDLTRVFFEEFKFFPFSPRDDLIDAVSRIYDMDPTAPRPFEKIEDNFVDQ